MRENSDQNNSEYGHFSCSVRLFGLIIAYYNSIFFLVWSKVQAALDGLGDDVKDVATKLVNKYKPKIMESLEKVKKMALQGAKSLLLELQGDIVKILTGDEKHLMKRAISDRKSILP